MANTGRADGDGAGRQEELGRQLGSRFSTAVILFHAAAAERMGLNVTDWKCASILWQAGPSNPGRLSELTGMSTAATSQVLGRLERAGMVVREPDPLDRRRTVVRPVLDPEQEKAAADLFRGLINRMKDIMDQFDERDLNAIEAFMTGAAEALEIEAAALRTGNPQQARGARGRDRLVGHQPRVPPGPRGTRHATDDRHGADHRGVEPGSGRRP